MTDTYSDASAQIIEAIDRLPPLRQLVSQADLTAKKSLGQNFLFDLNLTRRIARTAAPFSDPCSEIGPGPGGLTRDIVLRRCPTAYRNGKRQTGN